MTPSLAVPLCPELSPEARAETRLRRARLAVYLECAERLGAAVAEGLITMPVAGFMVQEILEARREAAPDEDSTELRGAMRAGFRRGLGRVEEAV